MRWKLLAAPVSLTAMNCSAPTAWMSLGAVHERAAHGAHVVQQPVVAQFEYFHGFRALAAFARVIDHEQPRVAGGVLVQAQAVRVQVGGHFRQGQELADGIGSSGPAPG